jgi:hypothetical protein
MTAPGTLSPVGVADPAASEAECGLTLLLAGHALARGTLAARPSCLAGNRASLPIRVAVVAAGVCGTVAANPS